MLGAALVVAAVFAFGHRRKPAENQNSFVAGSLVVSEFDEDDRGDLKVLSDSLGRAKRDRRVLLYDTRTPIRFSANAHLGAYVVETGAGIPSNEVLFSVTPAGASELFIDGAGLSIDGQLVPEEGQTVDARDGVTLKWRQRVFQVGIEPDQLQSA